MLLLKYNLTILVLTSTHHIHHLLGRYARSRICPPFRNSGSALNIAEDMTIFLSHNYNYDKNIFITIISLAYLYVCMCYQLRLFLLLFSSIILCYTLDFKF